MDTLNVAFVLRVRLFVKEHDPRAIMIYAYDGLGWDSAGRVRLTCEVRHGGRVIFPRGQLECALHGTSDGFAARDLVMSLIAMAPGARGGEGEDYYQDYTPEQLDWANAHWEALGGEREIRYCNPEDGSVRGVRS